jgi:aminopeptidase YwaD
MRKIIFSVSLLCLANVFAQSDKETVMETISKNNIEGHIYFLADDLLQGRETGTEGNKIAASYLANSLRRYGVLPNPKTGTFYQEFQLKKVIPPRRNSFSINGYEYKDMVPIQPTLTEFKGETVFLGYGLESDYANANVDGKLVVVKAGSPNSKDARAAFGFKDEKITLAKKAGAKALVEFIDTDENIWGFIEHNFTGVRLETVKENKGGTDKNSTDDFLYIWALDKDGIHTAKLEKSPKLLGALMVGDPRTELITTQNVIGVVEGTDPKLKNEYIIYSAHYDHVGVGTPDASGDVIYNGARDNAVGATTVLSMAENLAKYPTKRSALFILFTGEEKGLLGSKYYVDNPVIPLNQMVFCFNSDNAGYNNTELTTIIGLERTTAADNIKNASREFGLKATDDPAPEQGLFDRSDNVHFAAKGIPAPTFSLGFSSFDGDVTKYYHRPGDHADSLDYDYLEKFFRAYVLAGRLIANDPVTPFWKKGDKYEEAGEKLYDK